MKSTAHKKRVHFSRRQFLKASSALGTVGLSLPLLPSLAGAANSTYPKRLVVFFSGNGVPQPESSWNVSSKNGKITSLNEVLSPLQPHKDDLLVLEGLDLEVGKTKYQPSDRFHGHERGLAGILTGLPLSLGNFAAGSGFGTGISVDQFIANKFDGETVIHSLQVGLNSPLQDSRNRNAFSYAGADKPLYSESDGSKLFDQIFGGEVKEPEAAKRIRTRRKSVLDFLKSDMAELEKNISTEDKQRLEQHLTTYRDLEKLLEGDGPSCGDFAGPGEHDNYYWFDEAEMDTTTDFQITQMVKAFACDRTRVASMQFGSGLGALDLRMVGHDDGWHTLSHEGDGNGSAQDKLVKLNKYIASRFGKIIEEMKKIKEGDGTMLDNSLLVWVNELGKGNNHRFDDIPIVMAGNLQGTIKCDGRHVKLGSRASNDLLLTILHAFGHKESKFGLPELCTGPISDVLV